MHLQRGPLHSENAPGARVSGKWHSAQSSGSNNNIPFDGISSSSITSSLIGVSGSIKTFSIDVSKSNNKQTPLLVLVALLTIKSHCQFA